MFIYIYLFNIYQLFYLSNQRPTLMYDGLHDKPVKHYFSKPKVRKTLTHMRVVSDEGSRSPHASLHVLISEQRAGGNVYA